MREHVVYSPLCPTAALVHMKRFSAQVAAATGAKISFGEPVQGCDEVVITVSSPEVPSQRVVAAQAAMQQIGFELTLGRVGEQTIGWMRDAVKGASRGPELRLLVPQKQVGCILGKRGAIIKAMREQTRAMIKVRNRADVPACGSQQGNELLVLGPAGGGVPVLQAVLEEVLLRLRYSGYHTPPASAEPTPPVTRRHGGYMQPQLYQGNYSGGSGGYGGPTQEDHRMRRGQSYP